MPTQPFAARPLADAPRQAPNLAPGVSLPPAIRSVENRPGIAEARRHTRSAMGGDPGPNAGFALTLATRDSASWLLSPFEHRPDAIAVVGELAIRRAKRFHRAPSVKDVEFAVELLGYRAPLSAAFEWRPMVTAGAAHHYQHRRFVVDCIPEDLLGLDIEDLAAHTDRLRQAFGVASFGSSHG